MNKALADEHEQLGERVVRMIADHALALDRVPVCSTASPSELEKIFDEPLPLGGMQPEEILAQIERDLLPHLMQIPSPRYYGLFNPTPLPIAVWADALASAINQNGAAWRNSPAASVIEARVLRWLSELIGYGGESAGTLTSGGSEANLIALKCARDEAGQRAGHRSVREHGVQSAHPRMIAYASDQCHYSFEKSVDILGLGRASLRKIRSDHRFHIKTEELKHQIERDTSDGFMPFCIIGVAGATSTGIVDPLDELAEVARKHRVWFHVDAAYGGALAVSERHKALLRGIERADSVTIDPHKWMFVPFACGAVLARGGKRILRDAFDITPEYLNEERGGSDQEYDFFRYGQLGSRRFNALKIWMALKALGVRGYAERIDRQIELTRRFARHIDALPDFERVGEVETAVCCLRFMPTRTGGTEDPAAQDRLQQQLQQRIERSGEAWVSTTVLHGRRALRVNINSFLTEPRHIEDLVALLQRESASLIEGGENS